MLPKAVGNSRPSPVGRLGKFRPASIVASLSVLLFSPHNPAFGRPLVLVFLLLPVPLTFRFSLPAPFCFTSFRPSFTPNDQQHPLTTRATAHFSILRLSASVPATPSSAGSTGGKASNARQRTTAACPSPPPRPRAGIGAEDVPKVGDSISKSTTCPDPDLHQTSEIIGACPEAGLAIFPRSRHTQDFRTAFRSECTSFPASGSFSSGSSQCPPGVAQDPSATTDTPSTTGGATSTPESTPSSTPNSTPSSTDDVSSTDDATSSAPEASSTPAASTPAASTPAVSTPAPAASTTPASKTTTPTQTESGAPSARPSNAASAPTVPGMLVMLAALGLGCCERA
ncbi:hypothetical protein FB451DRAFT_1550689 [Mycena latifolia]|nr:hypothetical protein FB451DRAFT_1550689 [Mycena latifolia]